jgi:hypothetical protein
VDPNSILFTVPTISNDLAPLEPVEGETRESDFAFHKVEWSQIEFFPKGRLVTMQSILRTYKPFEAANRTEHAWRNVYAREIDRAAVIPDIGAVGRLEVMVGLKVGRCSAMNRIIPNSSKPSSSSMPLKDWCSWIGASNLYWNPPMPMGT